MYIGNINLPHGIILAPMAGITDSPFRLICKQFGCEYTVSEMISAKGMFFGDKKTSELAYFLPEERPIALQIFGSDPEIMAESAAKLASRFSPDAIDINMGCPVKKVVSGGDGSALMKNPQLAFDIISCVTNAVKIPVTVKIRSGWDDNQKNAVQIACLAEKAGAAAICVHGRTRTQMYTPPCDLNIISEVKKAVSIPVIGNGGILTVADAAEMHEKTNCDAVMIARGSCGNPWIFSEIVSYFEGKQYKPPTIEQRADMALHHVNMLAKKSGNERGAFESRKHIAWYLRGLPGSAAVRDNINRADSIEEIINIIDNWRLLCHSST